MKKRINETDNKVDPVISTMLKRFKLSDEADAENRKKFLKAQKFSLGGEHQWDKEIYNMRGTDNRPRESYNRCPQFTKQVTNDARMNQTEIRFIPNEDSDKELAEIREDLAREIQSGPEAAIAYETALETSVDGGWGYFRFLTDYASKDSMDQIIKLDWIPNPLVVYDDPNAQRFDFLDRKWLIHVADMLVDDFNEQYDRDYDTVKLESIGSSMPDWYMGAEGLIRVAEYWTVYEEKETYWFHKETGKKTEEEPKDLENYHVREVVESKVKWRKCTALEVLEERDWPGCYIPYCKVVADYKIVDGKKYTTGLVERMMAAQTQYNLWTNAVTEQVSLAPKTPWVIPVRGVKNFEQYWDTSNVRNWAYLPYNDVDESGTPVNQPQRAPAGVDISAAVALIQQADQNFYATTGIYPASLGQSSNEKSGKAILARQREGDVSTFHYIDNLDRAKLAGGIILNDLIKYIYDGSRTIATRKEDGTIKKVKINQKYKTEKGETKEHDMTAGSYSVMTVVGPTFTTKRQETAESQIAMLQTPLGNIIAQTAPDMIIAAQDWAGADKLAERVKRSLPPQLTEEEDDKAGIPPQVKQAMMQMEAQLQELSGALQQAQQELQSKQADYELKRQDIEASMQDSAMKAQSDAMKLQLDEAKLRFEAEKLAFERMKLEADMESEIIKQNFEMEKMRLEAKMNQSPDNLDPELNGGAEPPMAMMFRQLQESMNQSLQEIAAITSQNSQAIVESNVMLAQANAEMAQAIKTPKVVMRDEKTGMITGVR